MKLLIGVAIGVLLTFGMIYTHESQVEAQQKPFTVFQTQSACVFIAGNLQSTAMVVVPRNQLMGWKDKADGTVDENTLTIGECE